MALEGYFALLHKHLGGVGLLFADALTLLVRLRLRETEAKEDDENGRPSTEPEERAPFMTDRVHERACKDGGQ